MNIKTTLHTYRFDTRKPDECAAWKELRAKLQATGLRCMESHGGRSHYLGDLGADGIEVELERAHLFDNQWNTAPIPALSPKGLRVFDWALDYESSIGAPKGIKRGHYLTQTPEMRDARDNTNTCGYCGHQEAAQRGAVFCPRCIGSEYLKASELHLTRMVAVAGSNAPRAPLTDAERAYLLPLYKDAQLHGVTERDKTRITEQRATIAKDFAHRTNAAKTEHDGMLWLLDHGLKITNVIYYKHTDRFCFGWRDNGLDAELVSDILNVISDFPFSYDIKTADGRTLSNP